MKDKSRFISYLYGEMSEQEKKEMEKYLREHPEEAEELEELGSIRETLGKWPDEEVMEPAIILSDNRKTFYGFSRTWVSIAATLLLLIMAGFATDLRMEVGSEGFQLGFGPAESESFTKEEVQDIIDQTFAMYDDKLDHRFDSFRGDLDLSLKQVREDNDQKIDQAYERLLSVSRVQIANYVEQMDRNQRETIEGLMAMNSEQQQIYMNSLLTDFTTYLEEQRQSDLEDIGLYFTSYQRTTDQRLTETDQILASIISQVNGQIISD